MKRKIIEIDESKCNGCGKCIPNCPEGALQLIDGKVRLVSDLFCDGLGACIGECPSGAIHVVEREAEPYDEARVMETIAKQGANTIAAHLKHLKSHGEFKLFDIAVDYLKQHGDEIKKAEEELSDYLSAKAGRKIQVVVPSGGIRRQLVDMGITNAEDYLARQLEHQNRYAELTLGGVKQLKELLGLPVLPMRMECYDISHISGTNKVASMVVFKEGAKASNHYRHFKIKTVAGNNDFACMFETLTRRFEEWKAQKDLSFSERPDLIVIDGGKGQLGYVMDAMKKEGLDFTVISLAKRIEEVFVPGKEESILLPRDSLALKLLVRIRDEAHRFAITYHRNLRLKQMTESELTAIEGIGKTKARNLLVHFRKTDKIATASVEELMEVKGIGKSDAERIAAYFSSKTQGEDR